MEKVTFDVSMVHFLLMFGYKLFSLYYPLFLISIGFSLIDVGGVYLITYSAIAFFSLIINHYIHKLDPVLIAVSGILGYGVFSCMMLLSHDHVIFYSAQLVLGFSAAAWMISLKFLLMESKKRNDQSKFSWFYSMPNYAAAIAPAIGGFIIWKLGFVGVFSISVLVHIVNAFYAYFRLSADSDLMKKNKIPRGRRNISRKKLVDIYRILRQERCIFILVLSFIFASMLVGIYRAFLVIFLESVSYKREIIIQIISISSVAYLPLSFFVIRAISRLKSIDVLHGGILMEGLVSIFLGVFSPILNFFGILAALIADSFGVLMADTGKSSFLSKKLQDHCEEASTIDTIISTLFPALGSLAGGILISFFGYQNTFMAAGLIVFISGSISFLCFSRE